MTDDGTVDPALQLVTVEIVTCKGSLALWEAARGVAPDEMAWVEIGPATVISDDDMAVTVRVPRALMDELEAAIGAEFASSALEDEITVRASDIYEPHRLREDFLELADGAERDLPAGVTVVSLSLEEISDLRTMMAESEADVARIRLWRLGDAVGETARIAVALPAALKNLLETTSTVDERAEDGAGVVIMTIAEALRAERGEAVPETAVGDDGPIPF